MKINADEDDFLFFSKNEIEEKNHIYEISKIITKYNILKDENELIGPKEKNHLHIINYALSLQKQGIKLPTDLQNLFLNNITLKRDINLYLEKKLSNLVTDDTNHILKDINILVSITAIGSTENILDSSYNYNLKAISTLFRFYETNLLDFFKNNAKLFDVSFDTYMILLKTLFQLSIVNSTNILRNRSIHNILELITESVNIIKYTILLNNIQLSRINTLLGRYLYMFSHLEKIQIDSNDLNNTFDEFLLYFYRQDDGFELAKNNNFGFENELDYETEFLLFKNYSAIFILKLIKKLENIDSQIYLKNPLFRKIISSFYKRFSLYENSLISKDFEVIKTDLLNCLILNYSSDMTFDKKQNYCYVLEDFILNDNKLNNKNIETIYRILYFADDIEEFKYSHIVNILTNSNPIRNGYQEFFKLSILDLYVSKTIKKSLIKDEDIALLEKIVDYCMNNNADIHLRSILTKIYLNIGTLFCINKVKDEKIEELYIVSLLINSYNIIENNYSKQNLTIIKYLKFLSNEINTKLVENYFNKVVTKLEILCDYLFAKNSTKEQKIIFIKDVLIKQLFFNIVDIEFIDGSKTFVNKLELEDFTYKINSKDSAIFLYIKINEEIFNKIFNSSKLFIQDKLEKVFEETSKISANYYLDDDSVF
ncbi:hypothetical protein [Aliarcobacter cibarius]|uniref:Uncharacterized protein n=1 Tax=Aliarcobacter cibarius TaxID=255507 RepID=A0ABY2V5Q5_9BACT|nr:hypothetical protein [Aliarcobacter cibarius]QEZ90119.1 hypothetical protein ACIB15232_2039 [Aliarcobacter cibarius]TLT00496.1 hypothetical protein FE247_04300 [Aliarcobacter cibarius]TLT00756.1 hypothetical protein FE245_04215 [Aliarcobacter cibarius]